MKNIKEKSFGQVPVKLLSPKEKTRLETWEHNKLKAENQERLDTWKSHDGKSRKDFLEAKLSDTKVFRLGSRKLDLFDGHLTRLASEEHYNDK